MALPQYVLLTAAMNEAALIDRPLGSVIRQTVQPLLWMIASVGSSDGTDEIVARYAAQHRFIKLIRCPPDGERNFRLKALAIRHVYELIRDRRFDYIANLDADVSFEPEYFERILHRFELDPMLGVAGGKRLDLRNGRFRPIVAAPYSVGGPVQTFRRDCWDQIGGYLPVQCGGLDAIAETTARMKGWQVQSFDEPTIWHHRETGTASAGRLGARFREGVKAHALGYHPLFFLARTLYRLRQPPVVVGALLTGMGYAYAAAAGKRREVSPELVTFLRKEQLGRLRPFGMRSRP